MSSDLSPPSAPKQHWEPGWTGVHERVKLRTVPCDQIPKRALVEFKRLRGDDAPSIWAVGTLAYDGKTWCKVDNLPTRWWNGGSGIIGSGKYTCVIPEEFFDEEENEFGPVSP